MTSPPSSVRELMEFALRGNAGEAILATFAEDLELPLDSAEFAIRLEEFHQEGSRALMRDGYRLRLAERKVMDARKLIPLGKIDDLLRSSLSRREKTVAIAEYLDAHQTMVSETLRGFMSLRHSVWCAKSSTVL